MTQALAILTGTNVIQQITGVNTLFSLATFWGYKAFVSGIPTNNSSSINVGPNPTNLPMNISSGSYFSWTLNSHLAEDLSNFYFRGTSGDGVYFIGY